jgi:hypothetical protein
VNEGVGFAYNVSAATSPAPPRSPSATFELAHPDDENPAVLCR